MLSLLIACTGLLAAAPEPEPADARAAYRAAVASAGRDADAQVKLALWCEAHGLQAERFKHLALALLADPAHAAARGLMGLVADAGKWRKPEAVAARVQADADLTAALAEYNGRRAKASNTAEAQWKLALWCEGKGLKAEATAHLAAVVRLDPKRDAAWRRLGYKKQKDGRWATDAQVSAARAEAEVQHQADVHWRPRLERWKKQLCDPNLRVDAESALAGVTDPRAVPSVARVFGRGDASDQSRAVQVLGQVEGPTASKFLVLLSLSGKSEAVRGAATQTLRLRDPREVVPLLLAFLRAPIKYEVRPMRGPGSPGTLFVEGERFNVRRRYGSGITRLVQPGDQWVRDANGLPVLFRDFGAQTSVVHAPNLDPLSLIPIEVGDRAATAGPGGAPHPVALPGPGGPGMSIVSPGPNAIDPLNPAIFGPFAATAAYLNLTNQLGPIDLSDPLTQSFFHDYELASAGLLGSSGDPIRNFVVTRQLGVRIPIGQMMVDAERQLEDDVAVLAGYNAAVRSANERPEQVLQDVTGLPARSRDDWLAFWGEQAGYSYETTTKGPTIIQDVPLESQAIPIQPTDQLVSFQGFSCFGAGTSVHTLTGVRAIESLRAGDRVLTRDGRTGALDYRPILAVHHNPPTATLRVDLGGEPVITTGIHRFWKVGHGWIMARELTPGDAIRTIAGMAKVVSIGAERVQPVFNLDVDRDHDFFVGMHGAMVHDNSVVQPTADPFDAPAAVASTR